MAQFPWNFVVGGSAGAVASVATYPFDTVRRRAHVDFGGRGDRLGPVS